MLNNRDQPAAEESDTTSSNRKASKEAVIDADQLIEDLQATLSEP